MHATPRLALGGLGCGGEHEYVRQLAQALAASGWQVDVFTAATPEALWYDVLHAHGSTSAMLALRIMDELPNGALITSFADELPEEDVSEHGGSMSDDERRRISACIDASAILIARSPRERDALISLWGASRDRIRLIPCGVDVDRFRRVARTHARAALGIPNDDFVIMHVGHLRTGHGINDTIEALSILRHERHLCARLMVIGAGHMDSDDRRMSDEVRRLEAVAEMLGVRDALSFVGAKCGNVLRFYYSAADVYTTTPRTARAGMSALEAMACGTPVVGTSLGGVAYVVAHEETGLLVRPGEPAAIADAIHRLAEAREARLTMGAHGQQRAASMFSWSEVGRSLSQLYSDVAQSSRPHKQSRTDARKTLSDDGRAADGPLFGT